MENSSANTFNYIALELKKGKGKKKVIQLSVIFMKRRREMSLHKPLYPEAYK